MSLIRRMSDVVGEKVSAVLSHAEDPNQALDYAYQKQIESLQQVRRSVADVLTSEKRLELQSAQLQQSQVKLQAQAKAALAQGREDLARLALTRAQAAQTQLDGLSQQIDQLKDQEQKLELTAQKLQAKVESFRTQKETIKAQYSAAEASTKIGEAVTGLSEQMADVSLMVDRAQEKTTQMQARAAAIDQLVDTGVLDQIGAGSSDEIDRQLAAAGAHDDVEAQLAAMKQSLSLPAGAAPQLGTGQIVVRIQGEDQYALDSADRQQLDSLDQELVAAIRAGDEPAFKGTLTQAIAFVRERGRKLDAASLEASDLVLPAEDMSIEEATKILEGAPSPAKGCPGIARVAWPRRAGGSRGRRSGRACTIDCPRSCERAPAGAGIRRRTSGTLERPPKRIPRGQRASVGRAADAVAEAGDRGLGGDGRAGRSPPLLSRRDRAPGPGRNDFAGRGDAQHRHRDAVRPRRARQPPRDRQGEGRGGRGHRLLRDRGGRRAPARARIPRAELDRSLTFFDGRPAALRPMLSVERAADLEAVRAERRHRPPALRAWSGRRPGIG